VLRRGVLKRDVDCHIETEIEQEESRISIDSVGCHSREDGPRSSLVRGVVGQEEAPRCFDSRVCCRHANTRKFPTSRDRNPGETLIPPSRKGPQEKGTGRTRLLKERGTKEWTCFLRLHGRRSNQRSWFCTSSCSK
jgi:hypothetical protein